MTTFKMGKAKGYKTYKHYWENQANFIGQSPWNNEKVLKITFLNNYENCLKELDFLDH